MPAFARCRCPLVSCAYRHLRVGATRPTRSASSSSAELNYSIKTNSYDIPRHNHACSQEPQPPTGPPAAPLLLCGLYCACAIVLPVAGAAGAQSDFPNRPIRLIVTSAAGGSGDNIARIVAKLVSAELNATIVIDNRPGASGIIATETVVRAEPNGYTLLQTSSSLITNAASGRKLPYDVLKDLLPLTNLATAEGYLVLVHPGLGVTSVK